MNRGIAVGVLAVIGLLLAAALQAELRTSRPLRQNFSYVAFIGCWMFNLGDAASRLTAPPSEDLDVFYRRIPASSAWAQAVQQLSTVALVALAFAAILNWLGCRKKNISLTGVIAMMLWASVAISTLVAGDWPFGIRSLTLVGLILAAALHARSIAVGRAIATFAMTYGLAGVLVALIEPSNGLRDCGVNKCGVLGYAFVGIGSSQNTFGLCVAVAVPIVVIFNTRFRFTTAILLTTLCLASGDRTAIFAAIVGLGGSALWSFAQRKVVPLGVLASYTALIFAVGATIPFLSWGPDAFTGRAYLWQLASSIFSTRGNLVIGLGSDTWGSLYSNSGLIASNAAYSVHNTWLDTLFQGGLIALLLLVALLLASVYDAVRCSQAGVVLALISPVLAMGVLERPWSLTSTDWLTWSLLLIVARAIPSRNLKEDSNDLKQEAISDSHQVAAEKDSLRHSYPW